MSNPESPAVPRHAASVLLLREQQGAVEVLLTRRHENLAFMGGMWVFPGGTLSPADSSAQSLAAIPESARGACHRLLDLNGETLPVDTCLGLAMAAARETFEETGVLLATSVEGHHCTNDLVARLRERQRAIVSQPELFAISLQQERLQLDVRRLVYWAHWITPSPVPKRFDTRFYLASLPPEQSASVDNVEATELRWMTPSQVIAAAHDGTMSLSRPTLYNLMELDASVRQHVSLNAILANEAQRQIAPVLPKILKSERMIVMPWDDEYHMLSGVGVPRGITYPQRFNSLPARTRGDR